MLNILEGALFASGVPMSVPDLKKLVCPELSLGEIRNLLSELQAQYAQRGIHLIEVASGYRFQIASQVSAQLMPLLGEKPTRFSRAFMETLAIIAYRQPITRGDIEAIRGVVVSTNIMRNLTELDWIKVVGYKEVPGKPALYATTKAFLDFFNLKSLENLPALTDLIELKDLNEFTMQLDAQMQLSVQTELDADLDTKMNTESELELELELELKLTTESESECHTELDVIQYES